MKGLLKEESEIEKLKREYEQLSKINFNLEKTDISEEELVLEECEL